LVLAKSDRQRVLTAGHVWSRGGAIQSLARGRKASSLHRDKRLTGVPVTPTQIAAFYRKAMLDELPMVFDPALGQEAAALDLGLQLRRLGYRTICQAAASVVATAEAQVAAAFPFRGALQAERVFLRHVPAGRWGAALLAHAGSVALEFLQNLPRLACLTRLAGRAAAWFSLADERRRYACIEKLARELAQADRTQSAEILQMHPPHNAAPRKKPRRVRDSAAG
jgi:hypothetical protein